MTSPADSLSFDGASPITFDLTGSDDLTVSKETSPLGVLNSNPSPSTISSEAATVPVSPAATSQVDFPASLSINSSGYPTSPASGPASVPTAAPVTSSPALGLASVPTAEGGDSRVNQDNLNQKTGENRQANSPIPVVDRGDFYWADGQPVKLLQRNTQITLTLTDRATRLNDLLAAGQILEGLKLEKNVSQNTYILSSKTATAIDIAQIEARLGEIPGVRVAPVYQSPLTNTWLVATNEIIVSLRPGLKAQEVFGNDSRFASYRSLLGTPNQFVVTLQEGLPNLATANALQSDRRFQWASPNFYQQRERFFIPNDPLFGNQWHLNNTGQVGGTPDADVDAPEAWDVNAGGSSNVVVAVIDDGMQLNHPDLQLFINTGEIAGNGIDDDGNGWIDDVNGWDFTSGGIGDNNPGPSVPDDAHATAVAGVAAGRGNNTLGVTGMAYNSRLLPVRIFLGGSATSDANIASAIYYAAGRTASGTGTWRAGDILNNSWGGGAFSSAISSAFTWASTSGRNGKGAISYIATGNGSGAPVSFPANLSSTIPGVIAVGASTNLDQLASYSNVGPQVDFVAPSSGGTARIVTTDRTGADGYSSGDYTSTGTDGFGGTSSATPLSAGIGALILAQDPNLTAAQVRGLMRNTTDLIGPVAYDNKGFNTQYGYGRVNANTAIRGVGIAEIQVLQDRTNIADNTGSFSFAAGVGQTQTQTFRVRNQGTKDLTLGAISLGGGSGFSLASSFTDTTLSVGESTTFSVNFSPTTTGTFSNTISFTNNDADESTFNFTLNGTGLNSKSFSNTSPITIPSSGSSTPYPSTINVSGLSGNINSLKVTLTNLSHTWPNDIDVLLVGPTGTKALLMSDVGGSSGVNNVTLTFDPTATSSLPDSGLITSGSYKATDFETGDFFNAPAPGGPYGTDFSVFNGINPNGTWSLYVIDDAGGDAGTIAGGWSLNIGTASTAPTLAIAATNANQTEGNSGSKAFTFTVTRAVNTTAANNVNWAVTGSGTSAANATDFVGGVLPSGTVSFAAGETSKVITVNVQGDTTVEPNENFTVTLSNPTNGATITTATAVGTIQNDDEGTSVTLASNYSGVSENGKTNLVYNFTRSGATTNSLTVNFTLGGTATRGNDYNAYGGNFVSPTTGNIVFASGQTTAQIEIVTTGDSVREANETIAFTLASGSGYTIGTPGAVTTMILNDDGVLNQQGTTGNDVIEAGTTRNLSGRAGHDILIGSNASDMLVGGAGNDTITSGTGFDVIAYSLASEGQDTITDFNVFQDTLQVSAAGFGGGLIAGESIAAAQFVLGTVATTASHRFIFNKPTGQLFFDVDGNGSGAARLLATLTPNLNLTADNIFAA
ncbi:S8 family serine peptidase [Microcystis aeruginosa CS-583]|uniref:S8 family serine peptidase n=2 Tax=Microcystaceae TaxID=1890449 RepID=A0ABR8GFL2_MICVR|nr:S8 family serine peptidase [Microcystis viridis FACHB-1342]MDB9388499.1 S8 family serine peptidase [Microcystis aeruginosa CS-583]